MIRYLSLASGSSGNCSYIATKNTALLNEAGIGVRTIKRNLLSYGISLASINAVLVTHDHKDHVSSTASLGERQHIPIYSTQAVFEGVNRYCPVANRLTKSAKCIAKEIPFQIGDFTITAFSVPHDSTDCVGYLIEAEGITFAIATDVGHITPTIAHHLKRAHYMVLEANYDPEMLRTGPYPADLKMRIKSGYGHLSNGETADFLTKIYSSALKRVWLCHLSNENNTPQVAMQTITAHLRQAGIKVGEELLIEPLKRSTPMGFYELQGDN